MYVLCRYVLILKFRRGMVVWEGIAGTCVRYTRRVYASGMRTGLTHRSSV